MSRPSRTRSTPKGAFQFQRPSAPCSSATPTAPGRPERPGGGIYCYPSLDAPALDAGGERLAQKIDRLLAGLPDYSDERDELSVALYGDVQVLGIDGDGRIVLPEAASRPRRHRRPDHVCRPWRQVSDVEPGTLRRTPRGRPRQRSTPIAGFLRADRARTAATEVGKHDGSGAIELTRLCVPLLFHDEKAQTRQPPRGPDRHSAQRGRPHSRIAGQKCWQRSAPRDGATYIDATFGAGGYTAAILGPRSAMSWRSTAIPARSARRSGVCERYPGRLTVVQHVRRDGRGRRAHLTRRRR